MAGQKVETYYLVTDKTGQLEFLSSWILLIIIVIMMMASFISRLLEY